MYRPKVITDRRVDVLIAKSASLRQKERALEAVNQDMKKDLKVILKSLNDLLEKSPNEPRKRA